MYTILNYSPNFDVKKKKTKPNQIYYYSLYGNEKRVRRNRKTYNIKSKVSSHYLIKNNGEIIVMVPDLYEAWHAGISSWKNFNSLNKALNWN